LKLLGARIARLVALANALRQAAIEPIRHLRELQ
jgi:hypothetical protein